MLLWLAIASAVSDVSGVPKSIYGGPGRETIELEFHDAVEVIREFPKPETKDIRQAKWSSRPLKDEEYPYPGHTVNVSVNGIQELLKEECDYSIFGFHRRFNMTQEELYKHPFGPEQFEGLTSEIDAAPRVEVKFLLDPRFGWRHFTGLYMPPGELITIEMPGDSSDSIGYWVNFHTKRKAAWHVGGDQNRLPHLTTGDLPGFKRQVVTIGFPIGGALWLQRRVTDDEPIEVKITGGVMSPWFRYGIDSDEDWERIKRYPGPVTALDTGNLQFVLPSSRIREITRINDACQWFRSCKQMMESTAEKTNNYGDMRARPNGRERIPTWMFVDSYVPKGAAVAFIGAVHVQMPFSWSGGIVDIEQVMGGTWGVLHEMAHHHQPHWGIGYTGEVTNNVFCVMSYCYYSTASGFRMEAANGGIEWRESQGWQDTSHFYSTIHNTEWLRQYISMMYSFGMEKMREFIYADSHNFHFDESDCGVEGAYLLRATKIFGKDMRPHLQFHEWNLSDRVKFTAACIKIMDDMNYPPFFPLANLYTNGVDVNGTVEWTGRPFEIWLGEKKVFDFPAYTRTRKDCGTFVFKELTSKRPGAWKELSHGVYEYTPLPDKQAIDQYRVSWLEEATNQVIVHYGQIKQLLDGHAITKHVNVDGPSAVDAYNATKGRTPNWTGFGHGITLAYEGSYGDREKSVRICRGSFWPPTSGTYKFYATPDDAAAFYISENALHGDPTLDADSLILEDTGQHSGWDENKASSEIELEAGRPYSFCFVIYSSGGRGGGSLGYRIGDAVGIVHPSYHSVSFDGVTDEDIKKSVFHPETWERMRGMSDWYGGSRLVVDRSSVTGPEPESEGRPLANLIDSSTGTWYVTKYTTPSVEFPHEFVVELNPDQEFDAVVITNCSDGNQGYAMYSTIEIRLSTDGEDDTIVYSGYYNSKVDTGVYELTGLTKSQRLKVIVYNNTYIYQNAGRVTGGSSFSGIMAVRRHNASKVVPVTNSWMHFSGNWVDKRYGSYYNGVGKEGSAGAELETTLAVGVTDVVVVGDRPYTGDSARVLATNRADVYIDGGLVGALAIDMKTRPLYTERAYKQALYLVKGLDPNRVHKLKVVVKSGSVVLAGVARNRIPSDEFPPVPFSPTYEPVPVLPTTGGSEGDADADAGGLSDGALSGIIIGVLVVVGCATVGIVFLVRKKVEEKKILTVGLYCGDA